MLSDLDCGVAAPLSPVDSAISRTSLALPLATERSVRASGISLDDHLVSAIRFSCDLIALLRWVIVSEISAGVTPFSSAWSA